MIQPNRGTSLPSSLDINLSVPAAWNVYMPGDYHELPYPRQFHFGKIPILYLHLGLDGPLNILLIAPA